MGKKKKKIKIDPPANSDQDTTVFIDKAKDLKEESNKLFQKTDFKGAILTFEKAVKLLPNSKYSKALLKRAKCYEALGHLDFAIKDVESVLSSEPSNATALEISQRVRNSIDFGGIKIKESIIPSNMKKKLKKKFLRMRFQRGNL